MKNSTKHILFRKRLFEYIVVSPSGFYFQLLDSVTITRFCFHQQRRWRSRLMMVAVVAALAFGRPAMAQVIVFEGNSFPELEGWTRLPQGAPHGERSTEGGWFVQTVCLPEGWLGPTGEQDFYRMPLTEFVGSASFFIEWRVITDSPSWLIDLWQVPVVLVAGGNGAAFYHTTITSSLSRLLRSLYLPITFATIEFEFAHTYRLETYGEIAYNWWIDGVAFDSGIPEGAYPDPTASVTWGAERDYVDATTRWDFIRYGKMPQKSSGDYDSDRAVTLVDQYFVYDCLTKAGPGIFGGPGNDAGPGCRFADFDFDADVDLLDFAEFQSAFGATHP